MLARTLLQPAPPTTFGLKAAGWFGAVLRSGVHMIRALDDACVLQFGGASGTLAALGSNGVAVASELARELGVKNPGAPWHAHRDRLASFVAACGVYTGTIAKIARDIALLMQDEVAEAAERGWPRCRRSTNAASAGGTRKRRLWLLSFRRQHPRPTRSSAFSRASPSTPTACARTSRRRTVSCSPSAP
jgi:hypothetical protein